MNYKDDLASQVRRPPTSSRREALKGLAGGAVAASSVLFTPSILRAQNRKFRFKCGISIPEVHPTVVGLRAAAKDILAASNGVLEVEIFPNGQLGGDAAAVSQLRAGGIEIYVTTGLIWANLAPAATISSIAFAFPDYKTLWAAQDGDLGEFVRSKLIALNLVPMNKGWDNGFRNITSAKPILTPDDLKGVKIRVPQSALSISTFSALGAAPTGISFNELYSALQTRIVDAQENALPAIESAKLYEVQAYCSLTRHMWDGFIVCANKRAWDGLPSDLQKIATDAFDKRGLEQREALQTLDNNLKATLAGRGMKFLDVDVTPFRQTLRNAGFYPEWKEKLGSDVWAAMEKYTGPLT